MKRLQLLFHTIRYLRLRQVAYRLYYRFRKLRLKPVEPPVLRGRLQNWSCCAFIQPASKDGWVFEFLGEQGSLQEGWNSPERSKLWLYNLHYHDDLNSVGADNLKGIHADLINRWIAENPPLTGNGWESYCLSLRIVNWVKWLVRQPRNVIEPDWLESLAVQTQALEQQLEFHILGNHLFANAKALVFAGSFLEGQQGDVWLARGLRLLDREIEEQFLEDGGHLERSPMYHATLLWDMCDLLCLQQEANLPGLTRRAEHWQRVIKEGLLWLKTMVHPDADIAFFNDAAFGIAPTLADLETYVTRLGVAIESNSQASDGGPDSNGDWQLAHLWDSGYIALTQTNSGHKAILDVAEVGPDYQPGHAHADTLSFELSLFGQRVMVNSGTSQYGEGEERQRQRSTSAHNTVEVDGENSSEVWAGFRVARRARPGKPDISEASGGIRVVANHDGYRRLPGKVTHQRIWEAEAGTLCVEDHLSGQFNEAVARFHFHPEVALEQLDDAHWRGRLPEGQLFNLHIKGGATELQAGTWHPSFGQSIRNHCLVVRFQSTTLVTDISWSES